MNKVSESSIKYLSGLLDADGCLVLIRRPSGNLGLRLTIGQSIQGHELLYNLYKEYGCGYINKGTNPNMLYWSISKRSDLEMLLPRLGKHMVIKATHWARLYDASMNNDLTFDTKASRATSGPLKPRNHPTWAWVAGYLDGDGHYLNKWQRGGDGGKYKAMRVGAVAHTNDRVALDLLYKAFGGTIRQETDTVLRWYRNLGVSQASFALRFLTKVVKHARLKRHKIELLIHEHRQRLSEKHPTG